MSNIISQELSKLANPAKALHSTRFFKTGKGQYGEGDEFLGITVPQIRSLVKTLKQVDLETTIQSLQSKYHEERLCALLILVAKFKSNKQERQHIYELYLANTAYVNNWDLVDSSAPYIVGPFLEDKSKDILYSLAKSTSLWERRIAMLATFHYIRRGDPIVALEIAEILLHDKEDLIHKAVGWMLREIGEKCGESTMTSFLDKHYHNMPRTMLRYAIEKLTEDGKQKYMSKG